MSENLEHYRKPYRNEEKGEEGEDDQNDGREREYGTDEPVIYENRGMRGAYRGGGRPRGRYGRFRREYYDDRERNEDEEGEDRPPRKDYGERGY